MLFFLDIFFLLIISIPEFFISKMVPLSHAKLVIKFKINLYIHICLSLDQMILIFLVSMYFLLDITKVRKSPGLILEYKLFYLNVV